MNHGFITFSTRWKIFSSRDLFADVMSVHNRNMKHARAIEFDYTNLLAMLCYKMRTVFKLFDPPPLMRSFNQKREMLREMAGVLLLYLLHFKTNLALFSTFASMIL